ncbi:stearoyl-CoA desaturase [Planobispora rosea]|uniref:Stearoyl-CoA desaturase n=1 Tax=Planobispora rosea TaxID=35762 RepID=A0A8J3RVN8_PLARO|nr:acyl-CoA desaturase [Planobispora rosea]GGS68998.1 stearoyl-CoA desaturase [Planobispora rosea]GIH82079.1 stearoyl-CoA desaturase [Planobispora rosea]
MRAHSPAEAYDGRSPFPQAAQHPTAHTGQVALTTAIVLTPFLALAVGVWLAWGNGITLTDLLLAVAFYVVTGFGVTVGFHRLLTHRSFTARPWLRATLAVAGSMSFQGNLIDWVAVHRRHHAFTDRPGDPHSPYRYGAHLGGQLRGLAHAHLGWLFTDQHVPAGRYAPDLLGDPMMVRIARAFPVLCAASLLLPFAAGWAISGSLYGGLTAFLWAGLVRIALLQHVTWSVNSLCHMIGDRPHATRKHDRSTDLWPLAVLSFGESWHNGHHSQPSCARHGRGRRQIDPSATLIRLFERLRWADHVHWHTPGDLQRPRTVASIHSLRTGTSPTSAVPQLTGHRNGVRRGDQRRPAPYRRP